MEEHAYPKPGKCISILMLKQFILKLSMCALFLGSKNATSDLVLVTFSVDRQTSEVNFLVPINKLDFRLLT